MRTDRRLYCDKSDNNVTKLIKNGDKTPKYFTVLLSYKSSYPWEALLPVTSYALLADTCR